MFEQLRNENPSAEIPEAIKLKEREKITEEALETTLKRAVGYFSTIQAHDGHWAAESAGPLFMLPLFVRLFSFQLNFIELNLTLYKNC